jgi:hypothetical protein
MTRIIRSRSRSTTVSRPTTTQNSLDTTEETLSEHTENMWLFQPREGVGEEFAGERITGSLGALVVAEDTVDIQHNDRITHGGVEYEVDTIVGHEEDAPADGTASPNTQFFVVNFTRRQ